MRAQNDTYEVNEIRGKYIIMYMHMYMHAFRLSSYIKFISCLAAAYRFYRSQADEKSKKDRGVDKISNTIKRKQERLARVSNYKNIMVASYVVCMHNIL